MVLGALPFTAVSSPVAAEKSPEERKLGPFLCHADFSLEGQKKLLAEIQSLQQDIATILGNAAAAGEHPPVSLREAGDLRSLPEAILPACPAQASPVYQGARAGNGLRRIQGNRFEIDVRHESTHALLHASFETVPLWLDEGIAEYFEVRRGTSGLPKTHTWPPSAPCSGKAPRRGWRRWKESPTSRTWGADEYRDAWAWVHFMIHGPRSKPMPS